jgi:hypothetical protein
MTVWLVAEVRMQPDPGRPGEVAGYWVSLPGLEDRSGPVWLADSRLDARLGLGQLRARWAAGRSGAAPGLDHFDEAAAQQVYAYAAAAAQRAFADLRAARTSHWRPDITWAAADLLTSAAHATGDGELYRAAERFRRAARAPWGRAPAPSPAGVMLRTAAYLLAWCAPVDRHASVRRALSAALASLVRAVAQMLSARTRAQQIRRVREERARRLRDPSGPDRKDQAGSLQLEAARQAAHTLAQAAGPTWGADPAAAAEPGRPRSKANPESSRRPAPDRPAHISDVVLLAP